MISQSKSDGIPCGIVLVGYGHIGRRHAQAIRQTSDFHLLAIADIDEDARNQAERDFPGVPIYKRLSAVLADPEMHWQLHAAAICTPNSSHSSLAIEAQQWGLNAIIEKPMAMDIDECLQIAKSADINGTRVFCVLQNRYSPHVRFVLEAVQAERLGKIKNVGLSLFWNRDKRYYSANGWRGKLHHDGGPLYTQFSHFIDLLLLICGPLVVEAAWFANATHGAEIEFEDSGMVKLWSGAGADVSVNYSTSVTRRNLESSMVLIGTKGTIKLGGQYMNAIEFCETEDGLSAPEMTQVQFNDYGSWAGSAANHHQFYADVARALKNQPSQLATFKEAIETVALIEEIYRRRPSLR